MSVFKFILIFIFLFFGCRAREQESAVKSDVLDESPTSIKMCERYYLRPEKVIQLRNTDLVGSKNAEWTFDFKWRVGVTRQIGEKTSQALTEGRWTIYNVDVDTSAIPAVYAFKGTKHYNLEKIYDHESIEKQYKDSSKESTVEMSSSQPTVFIADQSSEYDAPVPVFDREYFGSSAVYLSLMDLKYISGETSSVRASLESAKKNKKSAFENEQSGTWKRLDYVLHQGWDVDKGSKLIKLSGGQKYFEFYFSVIRECKKT